MKTFDQVFVDTSYLVAILDSRDSHHKEAVGLASELDQTACVMVATDGILIELGNYFSRGALRFAAIAWIDAIRAHEKWDVLPLNRELVLAGEARYRRFADKSWSLTDCISMEAMRRSRVRDVATTDRHFEQAGFRVLL